MTEGLVPRPLEHWRTVFWEQAARGKHERADLDRLVERCGGCGRRIHGASGAGENAICGLTPAKDGYVCKGCFDLAYGGAA